MEPTFCVYADSDDECGFCPVTQGKRELEKMGIGRRLSTPVQTIAEAYKIVFEEQYRKMKKYLDRQIPCGQTNCQCLSMGFSGGSLYNRKKEAERYIKITKALKEAIPEMWIGIECQAMEEEDSRRLAEAGVHSIQYNLEVWDRKMFEIVCPGKAKYVGYEHWLECLVRAVPYFERGHVHSNQVVGCEMIPPHGFKTEDEALESVIEGHEWMARHGIGPSWAILAPYTSSKFRDAPMPSTEYFLRVSIETHRIIMKYNLYTPTRFFFCHRMGYFMPSGDFQRLRWKEQPLAKKLSIQEEVEEGVRADQ